MKTIQHILIFIAALFIISCDKSSTNSQESAANFPAEVTISGTIETAKEGDKVTLFAFEKTGKKDVATSVVEKGGVFNLKYTVNQVGLYTLNIGNTLEDILVIEGQDLTVKNSTHGLEVHGSKENELLHKLKVQFDDFVNQESLLNQEYVTADNDKAKEAVVKKLKELQDKREAKLYQSLKEIDGAYITLIVLNYIQNKEKHLNEIIASVERLNERFPNDELVDEVYNVYMTLKKTSVGQLATDINLKDVDGKSIALSSLKGKYVMVDFWASWCMPCRMENPNVLKAYNKYKSKGFEVYGISLDQQTDKWKEAIKKDGITWLQVHDTENVAAEAYGVQTIPFTLLLDKEGKIIAKNLRGDALEKKLAELLD
ncbi:AhpC/TSA family protein [Flammeovirga sp. MY04]|uniref:TlpA disulfide reductase family protein n=1 Tax=Flammeovirga sp. MY04 TaxID=1191459 RepID=UPI00080619F0|nr:TlpA disulfide reductase family protein [Flammeovirga sp. MY04]ANQ49825.1 AhpC/TSA family protein [Flammeovirga sp. MY04]